MDPNLRIKQLLAKASDFSFDPKINIMRYARSTKEMERMALVYAAERENENAFLLYMKLISLVMERLPKHPGYKGLDPAQKSLVKRRCKDALGAAEKLKVLILQQFSDDYQRLKAIEDAKKKKEEELLQRKSLDSATTPPVSTALFDQPPDVPSTDFHDAKKAPPSYPAVPKVHPSAPLAPFDDNFVLKPSPHSSVTNVNKPLLPTRVVVNNQPSVPEINRATKPNISPDFGPDIHSSLDGTRCVMVPTDLTSKFLTLAQNNTKNNVETCAILTGKLVRNTLKVTHLVVPRQSGTSDSCTTQQEEMLFDVQDKYDLVTLGWIHTHPSQTSFLSSVDLHTQCSYQQLLPEALAIVCAPKYNQIGMYRLTPSHGLQYIASCSQPGFHPHPKHPPLFEDSPLVKLSDQLTTVIDLRNN